MQRPPIPEDFSGTYPQQPEPLPLPIRGTRLAVGAILVAVIATVVATTYLRIEQQLQATLEQRLTAVLNEQMHAAQHWLSAREELTQKSAQLIDVEDAGALVADRNASPSPEEKQRLLAPLSSLIKTGLASEIYLLSPAGDRTLLRFPENPGGVVTTASTLHRLKERGHAIDVAHHKSSDRILSFSTIGSSKAPAAILALAIPSHAMTQGLSAQEGDNSTSYAFDASGPISGEEHTDTASGDHGIPPGALRVAQGSASDASDEQHFAEYPGRNGAPVVGSWVWLDEYEIGLATEIARDEAYGSVDLLRQSFLVLVTLVGAALLGFLALGRWTLRVREESRLMTRRLGRLARAIQPLSAALEHDPSAVLLVDHEGTVVYANASSHRVLGVSMTLLGRDVDAVFENLPKELQTAIASGQDCIVAQGTEADDETLLVSSRPLRIDGNAHFLYMLRPITQQVRRQEVEHWKKLIRVLSHELNNALAPITSLLSSARTVNQMTHQDPRLGQIFENIAERTAHLVSFLEGYREVARLPRPAARETSWENFLDGLASQKRFQLIGTIPERPGYFDPVQLERVLVNVLNNAYEAGSPEEDVEVEVTQEGEGYRLNIQDRGSGMPEPVLKQAMLPFFSTKRTGTGVGLALSREIIEAHGGQLTLANRDGGGLVVSCFLPPPPPPPSRSSVSLAAIAAHTEKLTST